MRYNRGKVQQGSLRVAHFERRIGFRMILLLLKSLSIDCRPFFSCADGTASSGLNCLFWPRQGRLAPTVILILSLISIRNRRRIAPTPSFGLLADLQDLLCAARSIWFSAGRD